MFGFFKTKPASPPPPIAVKIDLLRFSCEGIELGTIVPEGAFFVPYLGEDGTYRNEVSGFEIGVEEGRLDYLYLSLENFGGELLAEGKPAGVRYGSTEEEVAALFGEPYFRDVDDDGEVIRFHEYRRGEIELQFEFLPGGGLSFITLSCRGVMSDPEQRKSYGCTLPWPPA